MMLGANVVYELKPWELMLDMTNVLASLHDDLNEAGRAIVDA